MEKKGISKGEDISDERILVLIERKKDEIEALKKILAAFDKGNAKEKHNSISPK